MYLLLNHDDSINIADDHPIDANLYIDGLTLVELPEYTRAQVMGDVPIDDARWDTENQVVCRYDKSFTDSTSWRQQQAAQRITQFYPLYKQLNILRSAHSSEQKRMALFIDKCRKWSNDFSIKADIIDRLTP